MSIAVFNNNNSTAEGILRFTCGYYFDDSGSGYDREIISAWGYAPPSTNHDQINTTSIVAGSEGVYSGLDDGEYTATQLSTDGAGSGAEFTLTIEDDEVVSYSQVGGGYKPSAFTLGSNYSVGDQVVLTISNAGEITPMTITVLSTYEWQTPATLLSAKPSTTYNIQMAYRQDLGSYGGGFSWASINVQSNKTGTAFPKPLIKIYDETLGLPETDANAIYIQDTALAPISSYWSETAPGNWSYTFPAIDWVEGHDFKIVMTKP